MTRFVTLFSFTLLFTFAHCGDVENGVSDAGGVVVDASDPGFDATAPDAPPSPTCDDQGHNGDETDIDCGGPECDPCVDGKMCVEAKDCFSEVCTAMICVAPSCGDDVANGDESDVDCGGSLCPLCATDKMCNSESDCQSGVCIGGICAAPNCGDGVQNQISEECDDGNDDNSDACVANCISAQCGDGFVYGGIEGCDDGNTETETCAYGQTACTVCAASCEHAAGATSYCGDAVFDMSHEECEDGNTVDDDGCSATCQLEWTHSCKEWLDAGYTTSGVYWLNPTGLGKVGIYCDQETEGGGWTLVTSSNLPVGDTTDRSTFTLGGLAPVGPMVGVWDGLRSVITANSDIRYACKTDATAAAMTVDITFFDVNDYRTVTTGTDADSCFYFGGYTGPWFERKNNLTGEVQVGAYASGVLEGEDLCAATDDFTIDFNDRGMDGNENDGTDWGLDDNVAKCGTRLTAPVVGAAWYIFVRE